VSREHIERTVAGTPEAQAILAEFDLFARDLRASATPIAAGR
jgi:hypothetical protein